MIDSCLGSVKRILTAIYMTEKDAQYVDLVSYRSVVLPIPSLEHSSVISALPVDHGRKILKQ